MGIYIKREDVPESKVEMQLVGGGYLTTQQIIGTSSTMMVATRTPGYHSTPHRHDCEQLNYQLKGEIWVFIEDEYFLVREGDYLRIPPNKIHWAWNRTDEPVMMIESHTPGLEALPKDLTPYLLDEDEDPASVKLMPNIFIEPEFRDAVEKRFLEEIEAGALV